MLEVTRSGCINEENGNANAGQRINDNDQLKVEMARLMEGLLPNPQLRTRIMNHCLWGMTESMYNSLHVEEEPVTNEQADAGDGGYSLEAENLLDEDSDGGNVGNAEEGLEDDENEYELVDEEGSGEDEAEYHRERPGEDNECVYSDSE